MAGYYYGQLSKEKKAVYDMLAAGCDALAAVIRVPDLGTEVLSDIYLRMKLDLPLLFFVTGFHYRKMPGGGPCRGAAGLSVRSGKGEDAPAGGDGSAGAAGPAPEGKE